MSHVNDSLEIILYNIIEELSKADAPIVFKEALALKNLLYMNNTNIELNRRTTDIDANWCDEYNEDKIIEIVDKAVKKVNDSYSIELYRLPGKNVSMGINILDENKIILSKIDMDIKNNPFYIICKINDTNIKYSNINKMMCDKLLSISGSHVFRRIKDLFDIYLIISNYEIKKDDIDNILKYESKKLGDFSILLSDKELIKNGYDKLKNIDNKPDFEIIWNTLIKFLVNEKFIIKNV